LLTKIGQFFIRSKDADKNSDREILSLISQNHSYSFYKF